MRLTPDHAVVNAVDRLHERGNAAQRVDQESLAPEMNLGGPGVIEHYKQYLASLEDLKASLGGIEYCEVQSERRVARGGCIVRTPVGDVDARVETKLERAREVVTAALARS